jgi:hypothetical protein
MFAMQIGQFMLHRFVTSRNTMRGLWFFRQRSQSSEQLIGASSSNRQRSRLSCHTSAQALTSASVGPQSGQCLMR